MTMYVSFVSNCLIAALQLRAILSLCNDFVSDMLLLEQPAGARISTTMACFVLSTADSTVLRTFVGDILKQRDQILPKLNDAERSQEYYKDRCTKLRAKMRELRNQNEEQLKAMQRQLEQCRAPQVEESKGRSANGVACVVCWENLLQVALVPCGHVCVCNSCSSDLDVCPMCRGDAVMKLELFFP